MLDSQQRATEFIRRQHTTPGEQHDGQSGGKLAALLEAVQQGEKPGKRKKAKAPSTSAPRRQPSGWIDSSTSSGNAASLLHLPGSTLQNPWQKAPPVTSSVAGQKRRADDPVDQRLAQQRRLPLKHEATIRKAERIPTAVDYPDLDPEIFRDPKSALHNAVQGFGTLDSKFDSIPNTCFYCTVQYESPERTESAKGEGSSKVRD